jgi:lipopolysaccharide biosynthesis protein
MSQLSSNLVRPGIILHVSNPDLAWEVRTYLDAMPCPADLYISTSDEAAKATLTRAFASWGCGTTTIRIVPKWGEDIASGLVAFPGVYDAHDIVLQLHLGQYSNDTSAYARGYALETLMGSREIVSSILNVFLKNPTIGMIAPQHFENLRSSIHWGSCFETAAKLAGKMGLDLRPTTVLDFPMGGLFWARSAALRPLLSLDLSSEAAAYDDDTLASAIERLSFFACEISGFRWIKIARPEICAMRSTICEVQDEDQLGLVLSQQTFRLLPDGYIHSPVAG